MQEAYLRASGSVVSISQSFMVFASALSFAAGFAAGFFALGTRMGRGGRVGEER